MSYAFPRTFDYAYPIAGPVRVASCAMGEVPPLEQPPITRGGGCTIITDKVMAGLFAGLLVLGYTVGRIAPKGI